MAYPSLCIFLVYALFASQLVAGTWPDFPADGSDLSSFVSRPDIRAPKLNITVYDAEAVERGLWFVAPYVDLHEHPPTSYYTPLQVGPHLYDGNGDLVWSGAHLFPKRSVFDFKLAIIDNIPHLSFILLADMTADSLNPGAYVTLDRSYRISQTMTNQKSQGLANMHEFNILDNGRSSIVIQAASRYVDVSSVRAGEAAGWMIDEGFQEVDKSGNILFEWWALDHLEPSESVKHRDGSITARENSWDFFHANSVDKLESGDYLLSARHTSTIYRISGSDGSIMWRLGGKNSNFSQDFEFSSQHDARVLSDTNSSTILSFLNNAANGEFRSNTSSHSSALVVTVDTSTWSANAIETYARPDGGLTSLRGNVQRLSNGNTFVGWSENNYVSEYSAKGDLVLEGQLTTHRYDCYRSYKFPWVSFAPSEPPTVKSYSYGPSSEKATTVAFATWNGATEIARWQFFAASQGEDGILLADVQRRGFETMAMVDGFHDVIYAEAYTRDGKWLGRSKNGTTVVPDAWAGQVGHDSARMVSRVGNQASGVAGVCSDMTVQATSIGHDRLLLICLVALSALLALMLSFCSNRRIFWPRKRCSDLLEDEDSLLGHRNFTLR